MIHFFFKCSIASEQNLYAVWIVYLQLALEYDSPHVFLSCGEDAMTYQIDLREDKPQKYVAFCLLYFKIKKKIICSFKVWKSVEFWRAFVGLKKVLAEWAKPIWVHKKVWFFFFFF